MLWQIDPSSRQPLAEQIAAAVRGALAEGQLTPGERLPTAKELAEVLGVNANTVLAAYRTLREEGIVEFRRGRGVRVSELADSRGALVAKARAYLIEGRRHGWNLEAMTELLRELS